MSRTKKTIVFTLVLTLILSLGSLGLSAGASVGDIDNQIKDKEAALEEGKQKEAELTDRVNELEASIATTEAELEAINAEISSTQEKIEAVTAELTALESEMGQQDSDLNSRLRVMYKNGDAGLLQVLLGSADFTEFIANLDMVKTIHNTDVDILETMEEQHKLIEEQQAELESLQASIETQKEEQAAKQATLESDKTEVAAAKSQVEADNAAIVEQIQALEAQAAALTVEIPQLTDPGKVYNSSGSMVWPVPSSGSVSSPYGPRIHPVTGQSSFHTGIDIRASHGAAVVAAKEGTVVSAGYKGSYGNTVIIDHGSGVSTLYAHNSSIQVSVGQSVSAGQRISSIGSTGRSTGPHLHFEVRVNGQHQNPRNGWV